MEAEDLEKDDNDTNDWRSVVAGGYIVLLSVMGLRWLVSKLQAALLQRRAGSLDNEFKKPVGMTPSSSSNTTHGVRSSPKAGADALKLSTVVVESSDSKPDRVSPLPSKESLEQCVGTTALSPSPTPSNGFEEDRFLDVVTVALNQICSGGTWYTSTKELQLASFQLCAACRSFTTLTLTVDCDTPRSLLESGTAPCLNLKMGRVSRVPQLRAGCVKWNLAKAEELRRPIHALAEATAVEFGETFNDTLAGAPAIFGESFGLPGERARLSRLDEELLRLSLGEEATIDLSSPAPLACMTFGVRLDQAHRKPVLPPMTKQLTFGCDFNRSIERVVWPASLEQLTFGACFNQPIEGVLFPASVQQLTFGDHFNCPIGGTEWPASLRQLTFGTFFNQVIADTIWPETLRHLTFGDMFDMSLQGDVLPALVEELTFGKYFNQPIEGVAWPSSIRKLSFGQRFNRPVERVTWPAALQTLSFGAVNDYRSPDDYIVAFSFFNQALDRSRWPTSLQRLTILGNFEKSLQRLGTWMPNLNELTLLLVTGWAYGILLGVNEWPRGLRKLTVYSDAMLEDVAIPPTVEVVYISRR